MSRPSKYGAIAQASLWRCCSLSHTVEPPVVLAQQEEIGIIIRVSVDELLAKMKAEAEAAAAAEAEAATEFGANEDNNEEGETDEHEEL